MEGGKEDEGDDENGGGGGGGGGGSSIGDASTPTQGKKPLKKSAAADRWSHDRFNPNEQAPKSRAELVNSYGYDIRNEDGPPRARRRKRYGYVLEFFFNGRIYFGLTFFALKFI